MKVASTNNVQVYTVSGEAARTLPEWLVRQKKRTLRNDPEFQSRVELLQDFEFPEASNRIKVSNDGNYAMATGTYKPHMRVYDFAEMSMKFERHTSAENIQFLLLSDDWTKSVHLQNDRSIEFHNQGGLQYQTRIPKFGRDLAYHYPSCDLYIAAASDEVYRLNLEQGKFLNSLEVETAYGGVNCVDICPAHQLLGFGTEGGTVEFWDPRFRSRVNVLNVPTAQDDKDCITALSFRMDGLNLAVGTHSGQTLLYDLRSPRAYLRKDQGYGLPMKKLSWLESADGLDSAKVLSADNKIIKIWSAIDGKPYTSIEPPLDVNDVCSVPGSGLIFVANEGTPMHAYFVPQLGPAPRWCSFLDNLTEEMEENPTQTTYDNYKFVTRKELSALGLDKLIGTSVVKSYMHGYFIDVRLWEQARLIANPFAYEEYREKKIQEKIEKERESRIRTKAQQVKVNKSLAARLEERVRIAAKKSGTSAQEHIQLNTVLEDDRFQDAFANPEFEIDEETVEFSQLNPTRAARAPMFDSDEESVISSDAISSSEDDEPSPPPKNRKQTPPLKSRSKPKMKVVSSSSKPIFSAAGNDNSFETLLAGHSERQQSRPQAADHRPNGEMQMNWKLEKKKRNVDIESRGEGQQSKSNGTRRSASKNVFRNIKR